MNSMNMLFRPSLLIIAALMVPSWFANAAPRTDDANGSATVLSSHEDSGQSENGAVQGRNDPNGAMNILAGSLSVTVSNAEGWSGPGTEGILRLFNGSGAFVAQQSTDLSGVAVFLGVPAGSGYSYTVNQVQLGNTPFPHLYWGKKTGIVVSDGSTTTESFTRNAPYGLEFHNYDTTTNESVAGKLVGRGSGLRAEFVVKNPNYPGATARNVRSSLIFDRDKLPPYDLTISSANTQLAVGATRTDKISFTINTNGAYYVTGVVYADSNGVEVETDGNVWSASPEFTIVDPTGTLAVNLVNAEGWSGPATRGRVRLLNATGTSIATGTTDAGGEVTFSNVPAGSGYRYTANEMVQGSTPFPDLYWGAKTGLSIPLGGTRRDTLVRNAPYAPSINLLDSSSNQPVGGGTYSAGNQFRADLLVKNPSYSGAYQRNVRVGLLLDRDKVAPYDIALSSGLMMIAAGESRWVEMPFTAVAAGSYFVVGVVYSDSSGQEVDTDGGVWPSASEFSIIPLSSPNLLSPPNGAANIHYPVQLVWRKVSGATSYRLQLSLTNQFTSFVRDTTTIDTVGHVSDLVPRTTYYWRVQAANTSATSAYSPTSSFVTTIASPILISPIDNATDISTTTMLFWRAVPGASQYRLQVGMDTLFESADVLVSDTTEMLVGLQNNSSYIWRPLCLYW